MSTSRTEFGHVFGRQSSRRSNEALTLALKLDFFGIGIHLLIFLDQIYNSVVALHIYSSQMLCFKIKPLILRALTFTKVKNNPKYSYCELFKAETSKLREIL